MHHTRHSRHVAWKRLLLQTALLVAFHAPCLFAAPPVPAATITPQAILRPRPADTPDVIVLSFAGYFTGIGPISSGGPVMSGIQLLIDTFPMLGYSSKLYWNYAPAMGNVHTSPFTHSIEYGLEHAIRDLEWIKANLIEGVSNPSRLVLVAASGGGPPMHLIPFLFPELRFDYMVDIDTACLAMPMQYALWKLLTPSAQQVYLRQRLEQLPRKQLARILGMPSPCTVGPRHPHTINNLVADNVIYDLDIRTALVSTARLPGPVPIAGAFLHEFYGIDMPYVPIMVSIPVGMPGNVRPRQVDGAARRGTAAGIYSYVDTTSFHGDFQASSDGARWAAGKILELGLPPLHQASASRDVPRLASTPSP